MCLQCVSLAVSLCRTQRTTILGPQPEKWYLLLSQSTNDTAAAAGTPKGVLCGRVSIAAPPQAPASQVELFGDLIDASPELLDKWLELTDEPPCSRLDHLPGLKAPAAENAHRKDGRSAPLPTCTKSAVSTCAKSASAPPVKPDDPLLQMSKVVKSRSRKSRRIDRDFLNKTMGLIIAGDSAAPRSSSAPLHRLEPPSISKTRSPSLHKTEEGLTAREATPRPWRDLTDETKATYHARALAFRRQRSHYVFTLRIAPALLIEEDNPTDLMRRRVHRELKSRLGHAADFWCSIEWRTETGGEFHLHGHIDIDASEKIAAYTALKAAGGKWRPGPGSANQLDLRPGDDVDGWGRYCTKSASNTKAELDRHRKALGIQSNRTPSVLIASATLRSEAEALYKADRSRIVGQAKLSKSSPKSAPMSAPRSMCG